MANDVTAKDISDYGEYLKSQGHSQADIDGYTKYLKEQHGLQNSTDDWQKLGLLDRAKILFSPPTKEQQAALRAKTEEQSMLSPGTAGVVHGATLGYEPQIVGAASKVLGGDYLSARDATILASQKLKDESPFSYNMGSIIGGAIPALATGGGSVPTTVGGAAARGAIAGGVYGLASNPGDDIGTINTTGQPMERATNSALGAVLGGGLGAAFYGAGKGISALGNSMKTSSKPNAGAISDSSRAMGFEPTPGMLTNSKAVQNLESSLDQSPSWAGGLIRNKTNDVRAGLNRATQDVFKDASLSSTPFESGEAAKSGMMSSVGEKLSPLQMSYDEIAQSTKYAPVNTKSVADVSKGIVDQKQVQLAPGSAWSQKAHQYADWLGNAKTVDDLSSIRTLVGQDFASAERGSPTKYVLGNIYDRISQLRQSSLEYAAKNAAASPGEGSEIAAGLFDQLKQTDAGYKSLMTELRTFAEHARLGAAAESGPANFVEAIESIPSEKMADRFFNLGDQRAMQTFKQQFPQEFETLRQAKLAQFAKQSIGQEGKLSPQKMATLMGKMNPEARTMLLGAEQHLPSDIQTVLQALPKDVNPSHTSVGESYKSLIEPLFQAKELGRLGIYKAATNGPSDAMTGNSLFGIKISPSVPGLPEQFTNPGIVPNFVNRTQQAQQLTNLGAINPYLMTNPQLSPNIKTKSQLGK